MGATGRTIELHNLSKMLFLKKNQQVFFALVKAGLWEDIRVKGEGLRVNDSSIDHFSSVDWQEVMRIAEEQSVEGLVTAVLKYVPEDRIPQDDLLEFIGLALQIEQQNQAMNQFVAEIIDKLHETNISAILVKGQGIAQCYEKPLWRACGDVDLLLSEENYNKAKAFLQPLAGSVEMEGEYQKHLSLTIDSWEVELHGTLRTGLSSKIDRVIDETQRDVFFGGNVRSWMNGGTQVFLPGVDNDVFFIFTHFLKHFYKGGLGLRQICDWARLLWSYREKLNLRLLELRIRKMGLMTEWKAFGAFAVEYLGMPKEAMPFYSADLKWKRKADKICAFVMAVGNFGHNRDMSHFAKYPFVVRKCISMGRRIGDLMNHARIFPMSSLRFFPRIMWNGVVSAVKGEG